MEGNAHIQPRSSKDRRPHRKKNRIWRGVMLMIVIGAAAWLLYDQRFNPGLSTALETSPPVTSSDGRQAETEAPEQDEASAAQLAEAPPARQIAEFRMLDLDNGWYLDSTGIRMITVDGGVIWQEADQPNIQDASAELDHSNVDVVEEAYIRYDPTTPVYFNGQFIQVKQAQTISGGIGWALAAEGSGLVMPLLVTVDGGQTWHDEVTAEVRTAMEDEKAQQSLRAEEAALYASPQQARLAMKPGKGWSLLPETTNPGDIVLVRRGEPGELQWQGKTYTLQPYKAGYYTYLPILKSLKPGSYEVGDARLIVKEKTFKTQHLEVTEQMESMRQDKERIAADQKKIDAARASSAPTFLFDSTFLLPLKGRLTTPFGYTRYINGKLSSSHMAMDIAAPEGTPIKATNDGVVALSEELLLTGNTIYLDHGMDLFSQYAHLSKLHVKVGDSVKKGDIIGLVGTTGFSTGPHLHFTFWAHSIQVNPNLFFDSSPFQWLQEPQQIP